MSTAAGFVVWVQGTKGPELQRWSERPETSMVGTYWYEMNARILAVVPVPAEDFAQSLDDLTMKYPAPQSAVAKRKVLECDP